MNNPKIIVFFIVVVGAVLRFWGLGHTPPSINWDEASNGYNAYSLLITGKDEYGTPLPIVFRSFDDYKPPLYTYLIVPSIVLFGLSEVAVRFPSAFLGTLTILFTYLLVKEFLNLSKMSKKDSFLISAISAFLLAISPWHIHFSHVGLEANIGVFLNVFGTYLFFIGLRRQYLLVFSAFIYAISLYAYHSERIFVPLLVLTLGIVFRKELIKYKTATITACIVGFVTVLPLLFLFTDPKSLTRLTGTSSLADQTGLLSRNIVKIENARARNDMLGVVFANRRITFSQIVVNGYLSHFNFNWLFINGDQERHKAPGMGLMYWWELPFLLAGFYYFASSPTVNRRIKWIVFLWFLFAPVAASPTTEVPHAIRTAVFLPTFQIFTAFGVVSIMRYLRNTYTKQKVIYVTVAMGLVIAFNFVYFLNVYFVHLNREYSKYWQYGYKEAVAYVKQRYDMYDNIVVSTRLEQPHIFFLFFLKYPPQQYLDKGGTYSGGFAEERNQFDKYSFRKFDTNVPMEGKTLYVGLPSEIPGDGIHTIYYLDGTPAFRFYETL